MKAQFMFVGVWCPKSGRHSSICAKFVNYVCEERLIAGGEVAMFNYRCILCQEQHEFTIPDTWMPKEKLNVPDPR
jgi:hypothetical protein